METSFPLDKIKIALFEGVHPRAEELLSGAGYSVETHPKALTGDDLLAAAGDAHMVGIRSRTHLDASFFESAPHLWAVGCFCIGTNQVDLQAAASRGVAVFNAPFSNTRSVAEKVMCEVIALHRRLFERSMSMHDGQWVKSASGAHEVRGRTLGIIGYGRIGSQVSVLAESLGMNVLFHDIRDCLPLGNARKCDALDQVLSEADAITLHVPDEAATRDMIGPRELALMKPGAFLINNARGTLVDVEALADAVRSGALGGAAVDVFPAEPKASGDPFDSPLRGVPNVILSPHIGGSTEEAQRNIGEEVALKLIKVMNNGSTTTAVNVPEVELPRLHERHHRILHFHRNVPGVLSKLHTVIADVGANIAAEFLQSDPKHGYVIVDIEAGSDDEAVMARLRAVPETIRVRRLL